MRQGFPQYSDLGIEIRRHILSFVATGPMEERNPIEQISDTYLPGSLTSTLPRVNKEFRQLSDLDFFWAPVLKRQLEHPENGTLWVDGLQRLLPLENFVELERQKRQLQVQESQRSEEEEEDGEGEEEEQETEGPRQQISAVLPPLQLLQQVRSQFADELLVSYKQLYRKIYTSHIQFDAPMFVMPCHLRIGQLYGLHLFEPRYRIMMHDLMQATEDPVTSMSGGTIRPTVRDGLVTPPLLIHANLGSRLAPGESACLVQVVQCTTYEQGQADVQLLPVAWCRLDRIWVRPNAGHLFYARATRLPGSTQQREYYHSVRSWIF
ncbi:hypothetical protein IV203_015069 [Nitzschia inconspicua]|uniref:Uncharacterized protein n=1 Tax=Nitzschia inconspicua TaxID=303405 RepID=A0A9K3PSR2_9STRA|nr:hypothetical protein IV203_015069 [Nitzschia inconspicua]